MEIGHVDAPTRVEVVDTFFIRKSEFLVTSCASAALLRRGNRWEQKYISVWLTVKHSLTHAARTLPPPPIATSPVPSSISTTVHATRSVQFLHSIPTPFKFHYLLANFFSLSFYYFNCCAMSIQIHQCYCYVYINCVTTTSLHVTQSYVLNQK